MAVAQRCPKETFNGKMERTEEDWMEWQANGIAAAILMPKHTFEKKADEIVSDWGPSVRSFYSSAGRMGLLAMELATYFEVSLQAARIRLSELGYEV
jgi:Zn-dependent peptidase ImmA (M78 family)